jgi:hypothetical protein
VEKTVGENEDREEARGTKQSSTPGDGYPLPLSVRLAVAPRVDCRDDDRLATTADDTRSGLTTWTGD